MTAATGVSPSALRPGLRRLAGGPGRVPGVDVARGIAVLGMFTAHVGVTTPDAGPAWWLLDLSHGHSSVLFAVVAGISVAIVSGGPRPLDGDPLRRARLRLFVRAALLLAVAALLDLLGTRVALILGFYACYFVLALPFLRWRPSRLAGLAVVVALVGPVLAYWGPEAIVRAGLRAPHDGSDAVTDFLLTGMYPGVVWMAYVLAGMAIGRCDLRSPRLRRGLLLGGLVAWGAFTLLSRAVVGPAGGEEAVRGLGLAYRSVDTMPFGWRDTWPPVAGLFLDGPHDDTTIEVLASGGFAVALVGLCLHVGRRGRWVLAPLAAVGSMALTVYTLQIVAIWHWDLLGSTTNGPLTAMVVVTLVAATAWRFLLGRGPLERIVGRVADRTAGTPPAAAPSSSPRTGPRP